MKKLFKDFYFVIEDESVFNIRNNGFDVKPEDICILQSILGTYNSKYDCLDNGKFLPIFKRAKKLMVDSGGFNILRQYPDYPFSVEEYNKQLNMISPKYAVSMDYNTIMLGDIIGTEYKDRLPYMIKTIDNYIEQYDMNRNYKLLIGLQGNTVAEKIGFIDILSERIDPKKVEYWGIGGGTTGDISTIDDNLYLRNEISKFLNKKFNYPKIHHFGISFIHLKKFFKYSVTFTSVDSWSWAMPLKVGSTFNDNMENVRIRDTNQTISEAKQRCLYVYIQKVKKLQELYSKRDNVESLF